MIVYLPYGSPVKLQANEAKRCSYPLRLDIYGSGCDHHCSYCYARAQMIVGGWNNSRNLKHPFPRVADTDCLRQLLTQIPEKKPACVSGSWKQVRSLLLNKLPLRVGAVTDCFQRYMESRTHTGLELLRILTEAKYPAQIVTKSDLIADDEYVEAIERGVEFLLMHRLFKADHHGFRTIKKSWLKLGFPWFFYDILRGLSVVTKLGYTRDERLNDALEILLQKQNSDGKWTLESTPSSRMQTNLEPKGKPSKWITLHALKVIKRLYQNRYRKSFNVERI